LLLGKSPWIKRMVQRQRSANQQPWQKRGRKSRERGHRQRGEDRRVLPEPALEQNRKSAGANSAWLRANRNWTVAADVPGDDREMRSGSRRIWIAPPPAEADRASRQ
jgi:hypothetical protein